VLERFATTIRLLQITEVDEVEEPFGTRQKGSSSMPHKRNPILCERVVGLARVLRGYALTAMEDVALWHERDISHSSAERVILPDACALADYIVRLSTRIVAGLRVKPERMEANIQLHGGLVFSQQVLTALIVDAEWPRERAYRAVQSLAARAREDEGPFRELVANDPDISVALPAATIAHCFDVDTYLTHIDETYRRLGLSTSTTEAGPSAKPSEFAAEAGIAGGRMH
jgi:adenylosuccinate lyase